MYPGLIFQYKIGYDELVLKLHYFLFNIITWQSDMYSEVSPSNNWRNEAAHASGGTLLRQEDQEEEVS